MDRTTFVKALIAKNIRDPSKIKQAVEIYHQSNGLFDDEIDYSNIPVGIVAEESESGGDPSIISTGINDIGGKSYGAYQFSSNTGTLDRYLKDSKYANEFSGMDSNSPELDYKWKEIATKDPEGFKQDQKEKAIKYNIEKPYELLKTKYGIDINYSPAVRELVISTGNQYGPNLSSQLLEEALRDIGNDGISEKDLIDKVTDYKINTVDKYFNSSKPSVRLSQKERFENERNKLYDVLYMSEEARNTASLPDQEQPTQEQLVQEQPIKNKPSVGESAKIAGARLLQLVSRIPAGMISKQLLDESLRVERERHKLSDPNLSPEKRKDLERRIAYVEGEINKTKKQFQNVAPAKFADEVIKNSTSIKEKYPSVADAAKDGPRGLIDYAGGLILENSGVTLGILASAAITKNPIPALAALGAGSVGQQEKTLEDKVTSNEVKLSETKKFLNSIGYGAAETIPEIFGTGAIVNSLRKAFVKSAAKEGEELAKKQLVKYLQEVPIIQTMVKTGLKSWGLEFTDENVTNISEKIIDNITGTNKEKISLKDQIKNYLISDIPDLAISTVTGGGIGVLTGAVEATKENAALENARKIETQSNEVTANLTKDVIDNQVKAFMSDYNDQETDEHKNIVYNQWVEDKPELKPYIDDALNIGGKKESTTKQPLLESPEELQQRYKQPNFEMVGPQKTYSTEEGAYENVEDVKERKKSLVYNSIRDILNDNSISENVRGDIYNLLDNGYSLNHIDDIGAIHFTKKNTDGDIIESVVYPNRELKDVPVSKQKSLKAPEERKLLETPEQTFARHGEVAQPVFPTIPDNVINTVSKENNVSPELLRELVDGIEKKTAEAAQPPKKETPVKKQSKRVKYEQTTLPLNPPPVQVKGLSEEEQILKEQEELKKPGGRSKKVTPQPKEEESWGDHTKKEYIDKTEKIASLIPGIVPGKPWPATIAEGQIISQPFMQFTIPSADNTTISVPYNTTIEQIKDKIAQKVKDFSKPIAEKVEQAPTEKQPEVAQKPKVEATPPEATPEILPSEKLQSERENQPVAAKVATKPEETGIEIPEEVKRRIEERLNRPLSEFRKAKIKGARIGTSEEKVKLGEGREEKELEKRRRHLDDITNPQKNMPILRSAEEVVKFLSDAKYNGHNVPMFKEKDPVTKKNIKSNFTPEQIIEEDERVIGDESNDFNLHKTKQYGKTVWVPELTVQGRKKISGATSKEQRVSSGPVTEEGGLGEEQFISEEDQNKIKENRFDEETETEEVTEPMEYASFGGEEETNIEDVTDEEGTHYEVQRGVHKIGMDKDEIAQHIEKKWGHILDKVNVRVYKYSDLSEAKRKALEKQLGEGGVTLAGRNGNTITIFSDRADNLEDVDRSMKHELFHIGFDKSKNELGKNINDESRILLDSLDQDKVELIKNNYFDKNNPYNDNDPLHRLLVIHEVLAAKAPSTQQQNIWQEIVAKIKAWMRKQFGVNIHYTDNDVNYIINHALQSINENTKGKNFQKEINFQRESKTEQIKKEKRKKAEEKIKQIESLVQLSTKIGDLSEMRSAMNNYITQFVPNKADRLRLRSLVRDIKTIKSFERALNEARDMVYKSRRRLGGAQYHKVVTDAGFKSRDVKTNVREESSLVNKLPTDIKNEINSQVVIGDEQLRNVHVYDLLNDLDVNKEKKIRTYEGKLSPSLVQQRAEHLGYIERKGDNYVMTEKGRKAYGDLKEDATFNKFYYGEGFREVAVNIKSLLKAGNDIVRDKKKGIKAEASEVINGISDVLDKNYKLDIKPDNKFIDLLKRTNTQWLSKIEYITLQLDGFEKGYFYNNIFNPIKEGYTKKHGLERKLSERFTQRLNEVLNKKDILYMTDISNTLGGGKTTKIKTTIGGKSRELTSAERVSLYMLSLDPDGYRHMTIGGFQFKDSNNRIVISNKELAELQNSLTDNEKKLSRVLREYYDEVGDILNEASRELVGFDLATNQNYYPIKVVNTDVYRESPDIKTPEDMRMYNPTGMIAGVLKPRVANANEVIELEDAFEAVGRTQGLTLDYIALAKPLMTIGKVLLNKHDIKVGGKDERYNFTTLMKRYGKEVEAETIIKWYRNIAGELKNPEQIGLQKGLNKVLGLYAVGALTWKLGVMAKQFVSIPAAVSFQFKHKYGMGALNIVKGMFDSFTTNHGKTTAEIKKYSEDLYHRLNVTSKRFTEVASQSTGRETFGIGLRGAGTVANPKVLLALMLKADNVNVRFAWNISKVLAKKSGLKEGSDEYWKFVSENAEDTIRWTQPPTELYDRPLIYHTKDSFVKSMTLLTGAASANFMHAKYLANVIMSKKFDNKIRRKALLGLSSVMLFQPTMSATIDMINMLLKGSFDWNDKDDWFILGKSWIRNFLSSFSLYGIIASNVLEVASNVFFNKGGGEQQVFGNILDEVLLNLFTGSKNMIDGISKHKEKKIDAGIGQIARGLGIGIASDVYRYAKSFIKLFD